VRRFSLRYTLLTYRLDQLWLPAAFWALFVIISFFRDGPDDVLDMARAYLGTVVPLIGGILAAYAVLGDPALELRFSTPIRAERLLLERLGLIFVVQAVCAMTFQWVALVLEADFVMFGNWVNVQLAWLVPTLSLMGLGCAASLLGTQPTSGVFVTGLVWLIELLARGWLAQNLGKYLLIFMAALMPHHPALIANRVCLLVLAMGLLVAAWALLGRQERYI
jgi:hypothetical protein